MRNRKQPATNQAAPPAATPRLYHLQIVHQQTCRLKPFGTVILYLSRNGNPLDDRKLEFDFDEIDLALQVLTEARRRIRLLKS